MYLKREGKKKTGGGRKEKKYRKARTERLGLATSSCKECVEEEDEEALLEPVRTSGTFARSESLLSSSRFCSASTLFFFSPSRSRLGNSSETEVDREAELDEELEELDDEKADG